MTPEVVDAAMQVESAASGAVCRDRPTGFGRRCRCRADRCRTMYQAAAAQEVMHRREALLARMRERGALTIEVSSAALSSAIVNSYLDIKQRNQL